ncbi:MAG TPA: VacJ family lipoprotein [Acetobacteraceae bacterium]|nr:VacJ family lipoprotein [Acetobacteraceae bacterium]
MRAFVRTALTWLPPLLVLTLAGCATPPPASDPDALAYYNETNDPLEPFNRKMYAVNNALDAAVLRPASIAYKDVLPEFLRTGIHNILGNLHTPVQLSNDMLEGKPRRAGDTYMRFLINTTVGVLGFFDVAKGWGYPDHDADFGMTMAQWGVGPGPYLYLPVLGPNDPRDFAGFGVDIAADPFTWVGQGAVVQGLGYGKWALTALDQRSRLLGEISNIKKTALDPYATFRSLYRQHRTSQIEEMENDNRATVPVWFRQPAADH